MKKKPRSCETLYIGSPLPGEYFNFRFPEELAEAHKCKLCFAQSHVAGECQGWD